MGLANELTLPATSHKRRNGHSKSYEGDLTNAQNSDHSLLTIRFVANERACRLLSTEIYSNATRENQR